MSTIVPYNFLGCIFKKEKEKVEDEFLRKNCSFQKVLILFFSLFAKVIFQLNGNTNNFSTFIKTNFLFSFGNSLKIIFCKEKYN